MQNALAITAMVVIVVQAVALLYLVFSASDRDEDHYSRIRTTVEDSARGVRGAFSETCTLDGETPVNRLGTLIAQLEEATTAVTDCAAIGQAVTDIKDDSKAALAHLRRNLPKPATSTEDVQSVLKALTEHWPTKDQWGRLIRLPDAVACDGSADVGCIGGQLALGGEKNVIRQGAELAELLGPNADLHRTIATAAEDLRRGASDSAAELKAAIDGPALAREALRVLNQSGARVEAALAPNTLIIRLHNASAFACSDLSASIAMVDPKVVATTGGKSSLPRTVILGETAGSDPVDIEANTHISLSLRALMKESQEVCQAEFGIDDKSYQWFNGKLTTHQLSVEISMVHPGAHHRVILSLADTGG